MQPSASIEIRLLFESDIPAAMKLKEVAGWNQTEDDWRRLLQLEPDGCFAAIKDGRLVGTTTTTTYRDDLAWIGMVLVDPQNRQQGIANRLMKTGLNYLKGKVATVKLDATPQGKLVYEKLGFEVESLVERWSGQGKSESFDRNDESLSRDLRRELLALDYRAFCADRSKLIESLIDNSLVTPVLKRSGDGELSGYALARRGTKADYIGPIIATQADQIESLLDQVMGELKGTRVYIDFNTECSASSRLLTDRGFVKERDLIRMSAGGRGQKTSSSVVAIAGPEIG
jgi:ribosomal protein S18 acetylase RimI-like enzyme